MGLAVASALVVLVASGVAISRIGSENPAGRSPEAASPGPAPDARPDGPAGGDHGGAPSAEAGAAPAPGASTPAPVPPPVPARNSGDLRTGGGADLDGPSGTAAADARAASAAARSPADAGISPPGGSPSSDQATPGGGSGGSDGPADSGGSGNAGTGQDPESEALFAASVSVGEGAGGAVVGAGLGGGSPDADLTIGDTAVIGDAPPSSGTGVALGGRFLHPSVELEPT